MANDNDAKKDRIDGGSFLLGFWMGVAVVILYYFNKNLRYRVWGNQMKAKLKADLTVPTTSQPVTLSSKFGRAVYAIRRVGRLKSRGAVSFEKWTSLKAASDSAAK